MKAKLLVALALFVAWNATAVREAVAEDFTFHVPLKVSGLPADVKSIDVWCDAYITEGNLVGGGGSPAITPGPNGNYAGTVVVKFNAYLGKNPADAKKYHCALRANSQVAIGVQSKPGTPRVLVADGDLPQ